MTEDTALTLKKSFDRGEPVEAAYAHTMLSQSDLVSKLLTPPRQRPELFVGIRALEWRLVELSEIPFTGMLEKVREWTNLLVAKTYTPDGYSLTGDRNGLLACHNAMITTVLLRLGYNDRKKIETGINWILDYQSTGRGLPCKWTGTDLYTRFGGCMKATPCFYGVVKSMIALTEYKKRFGNSAAADRKLQQGLEYISSHRLFKKLSADLPIDSSIVKNFYPFSYKSNLLEILMLFKANGMLH